MQLGRVTAPRIIILSMPQNAVQSEISNAEPLVMQIVVRRDLFDVSLRLTDLHSACKV